MYIDSIYKQPKFMIASGNQTWNTIAADLPIAANNNDKPIKVTAVSLIVGTILNIVA